MRTSVREVTWISLCPSLGAAVLGSILHAIERDYSDRPVHVEVRASPTWLAPREQKFVEVMPFPRRDSGVVAKRVAVYPLEMFELKDSRVEIPKSRNLIITPEVGLSRTARKVMVRETQHQSLVFVDGVEAALELARGLGARIILSRWKLANSTQEHFWRPVGLDWDLPGGSVYVNRNFSPDASDGLLSLLMGVISRSVEVESS